MKKIISIITVTFLSINSLFSQDCPSLNFEATNTGNNMTLLITSAALGGDALNEGDEIGVFYTNEDGDIIPHQLIKSGDNLYYSIAAASISDFDKPSLHDGRITISLS